MCIRDRESTMSIAKTVPLCGTHPPGRRKRVPKWGYGVKTRARALIPIQVGRDPNRTALNWSSLNRTGWVLNFIWEPAVCTGKYGKNGKFWGRKRGRKKKNRLFPSKIGKNLPKPAFLRSRDQGASTHIKNSKFKPIPAPFIHHFTFLTPKTCQNPDIFQKNHIFAQESGPGTHRK